MPASRVLRCSASPHSRRRRAAFGALRRPDRRQEYPVALAFSKRAAAPSSCRAGFRRREAYRADQAPSGRRTDLGREP